jgi:hypothetical protein
MSTVHAIFKATHWTLNQHRGSTVVHDVVRSEEMPWKRVVVKRRCACNVLREILQGGALKTTWFGGFNAPTLQRVFAELAVVPSYVLDNGLSHAFSAKAALLETGRVLVWGDSGSGGDGSRVESRLEDGVVVVASSCYAFAALKDDGSIVQWGDGSHYLGVAAAIRILRRTCDDIAYTRACYESPDPDPRSRQGGK